MPQPVVIRPAAPQDAPALLEIYAPYVRNTAISFEYTLPSVEEFAGRIRDTLIRYPYLVALQGDRIVGYAYASAFKSRAAYDWAVEATVYVSEICRGGGIGRALYEKLEAVLYRQHILNLNACIAWPAAPDPHLTTDSQRFHARLGYEQVAHFHRCGFKFNTWYDVIWMEKLLGDHPADPAPIRPFWEVWHDRFE